MVGLRQAVIIELAKAVLGSCPTFDQEPMQDGPTFVVEVEQVPVLGLMLVGLKLEEEGHIVALVLEQVQAIELMMVLAMLGLVAVPALVVVLE